MREAVRSGRRANFYITENSFIDQYARDVKPLGIAVYHVLERHANSDTRSTWISTGKMADLLGYSKRQIQRTLKALQDLKLIRILETEDRTTYVVVPVPPRTKSGATPLFDQIPDLTSSAGIDDPDQATPLSLFETPASDRVTATSHKTTPMSEYASQTSRPSDIHDALYKEEQDSLNKTKEQDLSNKISKEENFEIKEAAQLIIKVLKLSDSFMSAAVAAVEERRKYTKQSMAGIVGDIVTEANHVERKGVERTEFLTEFLARKSAHRILKHLNLPVTNNFVSTVTASIKAEVTYSRFPVEKVEALITTAATDDSRRGTKIDRFYFENVKWRDRGQIGKGQQQFERLKRARDAAHAVIDAQMDH